MHLLLRDDIVLHAKLNQFFEEFKIEVVSCPNLTRAPYNLAAAGLSGDTGILVKKLFNNSRPQPYTDCGIDIQYKLSKYSYDDVFVIGSGFAARLFMPYNGQHYERSNLDKSHKCY